MSERIILLGHGSGGRLSHRLIRDTIGRILGGDTLHAWADAAILPAMGAQLAFTTDTYVVQPLVFPGGDIGTLAASGTINDLAVMGARPSAMSCGLVIEEGFDLDALEAILRSLRRTADSAGVEIVAGDTKVVRRGDADGLYINTSGIGWLPEPSPLSVEPIRPGDAVIVSGAIAEHGAAVMAAREGLVTTLRSDCAPLAGMIARLLDRCRGVKFMRDPTRGGIATVLNEIVEGRPFGIRLREEAIPVSDAARGFCETLGLDPLYVANEGKVIAVVAAHDADRALDALRADPLGVRAARIGEVAADSPGIVVLETAVGGSRIVGMLAGDQLPRIC